VIKLHAIIEEINIKGYAYTVIRKVAEWVAK